MEETKYFVEIDGNIVAKDMPLKAATILIRALFEECRKDKKMFITIRRMDYNDPEYEN